MEDYPRHLIFGTLEPQGSSKKVGYVDGLLLRPYSKESNVQCVVMITLCGAQIKE